MLYYSGTINRIGDVDQGDTVMDYLPAERDRGITITSAAITFNWDDHKINLIDTPGHADFTFEVIRSIRVLDGAVTILDAVAGVEAQTEKVWKQAGEMGIPRIVFVNKMDREGAGFGRTVREIVSKLRTKVGILNIPYLEVEPGSGGMGIFKGVIDVIDQKALVWKNREKGQDGNENDGKEITVKNVSDLDQAVQQECEKARTALIETLSELNEQVVESYLEVGDYMAVPSDIIHNAIRQCTIENKIVPVLCGASFRNVGVQPLMDAVIRYLPSPFERPSPTVTFKEPVSKKSNGKKVSLGGYDQIEAPLNTFGNNLTCALAFKVVHDPRRGMLVFIRVYSGVLHQNSTVLNTTNGKRERVMKLLQMHANESIEVSRVEAGNIAVILGSKDIRTGDTIISQGSKRDGTRSLSHKETSLQLHAIKVPAPVFFVSVDPLTLSDTKGMNEALNILLLEDPSLHLSYDNESEQTLLSGMGELHLDIARGRLINDLKAKIEIGKIMVTYKETLTNPTPSVQVEASTTDSGEGKDGPTLSKAAVKLSIEPKEEEFPQLDSAADEFQPVLVDNDNNFVTYPENLEHLLITPEAICKAINVGIIPAMARGGAIFRYALNSLHVKVESVEIPDDVISVSAVSVAVRQAIEQLLQGMDKSSYAVMEPMMDVKVLVNQEDIGSVVGDMSGVRQGQIISLEETDKVDQQSSSEQSEESTNFGSLAETIYVPPDFTMYMSKHGDRNSSVQTEVRARVPLRRMMGYLASLRSMTQGRGTYTMEFERFERIPQERLKEFIDQL